MLCSWSYELIIGEHAYHLFSLHQTADTVHTVTTPLAFITTSVYPSVEAFALTFISLKLANISVSILPLICSFSILLSFVEVA
jgi:hypothetical protein